MSITIKEAGKEERDEVEDLYNELHTHLHSIVADENKEISNEKVDWKKLDDDDAIFVAVSDGGEGGEQVIGFVYCRVNRTPFDDSGEIKVIYVCSNERGKNIGSDLLNKTIVFLEERGVDSIFISTPSSDAEEFFKKNGFKDHTDELLKLKVK